LGDLLINIFRKQKIEERLPRAKEKKDWRVILLMATEFLFRMIFFRTW